MIDKVNLRLDWCSYEAAKYAVEHWHYSRRMPKFKQVYVGAWENYEFIGVVIFGLSITPHLSSMFSLINTECAELTRIALRSHKAQVSRIASVAIRMVKSQSPGLRLLVSYADPCQGHNGAIYQAMNWVYIGQSAELVQYCWRGSWRNDTSLFRMFRDNPDLRKTTKSRKLPAKYKYLYHLDDAMRKQIEPLRQPYPKRGAGETDSAPGTNPETGGASPTAPLFDMTGKEPELLD